MSAVVDENAIFFYLNDDKLTWMLAFNGGLYDVAGYILLLQLFTSSITGNIVVACASASYDPYGSLAKILVTLSFFLSGGLSTILMVQFRKRVSSEQRLVSLFVFSIYSALVIIGWILGIFYLEQIQYATLIKNPDDPSVILLGCVMAAAMGIQVVASREVVPNCAPTTVVTSTLTNVTTLLSSSVIFAISGEKLKAKTSLEKLYKPGTTLISFIVGALVGGVVAVHGSFHFAAIALCFNLVIMIDILICEVTVRRSLEQSPYADPAYPPLKDQSVESSTNLSRTATTDATSTDRETSRNAETPGLKNVQMTSNL